MSSDDIDLARLSSAEKRALLANLLRTQASAAPATVPAFELVPDRLRLHEPFPLTDIQQAYWVGRSGAFELGDVSIHFYAELDSEALDVLGLQRAWNEMCQRHDMLRAIVLPDGQQQILAEVPEVRFEQVELAQLSDAERARALTATRERLSHQWKPSDAWPGFEIVISHLPAGHTRLHLSIDLLHIDAGSLMILFREWVSRYLHPELKLAPIGLSFRDYVLAEHAQRGTAEYQRSLAYWRSRLDALPPAPELPMVREPGTLARLSFAHRSRRLDVAQWQRLNQRLRAHGLTASATLLAVYGEVLARWSRSPRLTLNTTLFNRLPVHAEVNHLLGDFTSIVLAGIDTSVDAPFAERAHVVQRQLFADLEHRQVSGIEVLRELAQARGHGAARMPVVFTSLLNLSGQGLTSLYASLEQLGHVGFSITQTPQVWLDHQIHEENGELILNWDAVDELFPPGLIDDLVEGYVTLLRRLADGDEAWQEHRPMALPAHQLAVADQVNQTEAAVREICLHQLVDEAVARTPDAIAVIDERIELKYGELQRRARRLSRRLRALDVRPGEVVAVVLNKGWEQAVAVLAIHYAGAAYVPIDPALPQARIGYLLEHSRTGVALTCSQLSPELRWASAVTLVCVDDVSLDAIDDGPIDYVQTPDDLSHVIYTSGSTGSPKGVMIEHRSVVNRLLDINQRLGVGAGDRVFALTSLSHDLSVYDLFAPLIVGAALVMPSPQAVRDPERWEQLLIDHRVTLWNSVPAFLEMLIEHLERSPRAGQALYDLRWAVLAGDWIAVELPGRLRALAPSARLFAAGGPTETTIWDIGNEIDATTIDPSWRSIPYGRPLSNARYYVLDDDLELRPDGVPGELYIGGVGLARGYFGDPERTAERFIRHPRSGERLYRSGDVGARGPDGTLEFIGRSDFQVKIRGYRVELGEIEAALRKHPQVRAAVVTAVGERSQRRLVAYVVGEAQPAAGDPAHGAGNAGFEGADVIDPMSRVAFKLARHGLRSDLDAQPAIALRQGSDLQLHAARRSTRTFAPAAQVSLRSLGALLGRLTAVEDGSLPRYRYPSAGGLYPVQTYLYVHDDRVEGLSQGLYYHHPDSHQLSLLAPGPQLAAEAHDAVNRPAFTSAAFSILLVGRRAAIEPLYGALARDFCLLEAGYLAQLLVDAAGEVGLGLCPIGGMAFDRVRSALRLAQDDWFLHTLLGGVPAADSAPAFHADGLRAFLACTLPEPMLPASFVFLDHLPLTGNGKIDRAALPAPDVGRTEARQREVEPRDELEQQLAALFAAVLKIERVGVNETVFELGGNSIHVVQIHGRLKRELGRELSIVEIFRSPTVAALAERLRGNAPELAAQAGQDRAQARKSARDALLGSRRRPGATRGVDRSRDGNGDDEGGDHE